VKVKMTLLIVSIVLFIAGCNSVDTSDTKPGIKQECKVVNPINGQCED
jgi:PBP1b-binding outer membrane lipoprotein LpoB